MGIFNGAIDANITKWFSQIIIPALLTASLAVLGWTATHAVATLESHSGKLEAISVHINTVDSKVTTFQQILDFVTRQHDAEAATLRAAQADHELRLRQLERPK